MPSVTPDKRRPGSWIASIRHLHSTKRRQIRISAQSADEALAHATELEAIVSALEVDPCPKNIARALKARLITEAQATEANAGAIAALIAPQSHLTLRAAWDAHPSTQRQRTGNPEEHARHQAYLELFAEWAGTDRAEVALTYSNITRWLAKLAADGLAYDTRRHRLLPLRRAAKMGYVLAGHPDCTAGLILDRRTQRDITPPGLAAICKAMAGQPDWVRVTIALGAFCGLRPSEIARATAGDLEGDVLSIGRGERKNSASRRDLPLPGALPAWIHALGRPPESVLAAPEPRSTPPDRWLVGKWLEGPLKPLGASPKTLRKVFATWASEFLSARDLEAYLGHSRSELAAVTERHYLARTRVESLRPAAAALAGVIAEHMPDFLPRPVKRSKKKA